MKEFLRPELINSFFISLPLFSLAFSVAIRKAIGRRDNWKCQEPDCDRSFQKGYMVHATHYDHDKKKPDYDTVDAGRILCIEHHLQDHIDNEGRNGLTKSQNDYAIDRVRVTPRERQNG
jgi:hypothetical protein